ncbi:MAG TPA: hypothetical protein VFC41_03765 [Anaerovoracaceae bacterium]|nr:hypothetical protein [Anaerovoracaceae bacterium]
MEDRDKVKNQIFKWFDFSKLEKDMDEQNSLSLSELQFHIIEIRSVITDIQSDNNYFILYLIFIILNVLKLPEKNYFCGGKFQS